MCHLCCHFSPFSSPPYFTSSRFKIIIKYFAVWLVLFFLTSVKCFGKTGPTERMGRWSLETIQNMALKKFHWWYEGFTEGWVGDEQVEVGHVWGLKKDQKKKKKKKKTKKKLILFFFLFVFLFFLGPLPVAYGGSQTRGRIGAVAAGPRQNHSNTGSKPRLRQRFLVGFLNHCATMGTPEVCF